MAKDDYVTSQIPQLTWQRRDNLNPDVEDSSTQAMDYMLAATDQDASGNASEAFMLITGVVGKIERQMVRGVQKAWKVMLTGTDELFPDNTLPGWRESLAALYTIREPFPLNPANTSRPLYSLPIDSDSPVFKLSTKDQPPANVTNEDRENVDITSFRQHCAVGSLVVFKFRVFPYGDAQLATDPRCWLTQVRSSKKKSWTNTIVLQQQLAASNSKNTPGSDTTDLGF
ncbi:hypothetical protein MP228_011251 [Amoeboaphelidium protococcarum]|nr:hypothetical protein MP228_011251 [Amoeboaphelidium protococcarum]